MALSFSGRSSCITRVLTKSLRGIEYDGLDRTVDNKIVTFRKSYVMTLARRIGSLRYAVRDIYLCLTLGKPKLI